MLKSELLCPTGWNDYELLDSGNFEKLERFGRYVIARPEPQAIWDRSMRAEEWDRLADARFRKDRRSDDRGEWILRSGMPEQWFVGYENGGRQLRMRLGLTSFKHVGIFPEQALHAIRPQLLTRRREPLENTGIHQKLVRYDPRIPRIRHCARLEVGRFPAGT